MSCEDVELAEVVGACPNCDELEAARDEMVEELKVAVQELLFVKKKLYAQEELVGIAKDIYREQLFSRYKIGSNEKAFDLRLHEALGRYNEVIGSDGGCGW